MQSGLLRNQSICKHAAQRQMDITLSLSLGMISLTLVWLSKIKLEVAKTCLVKSIRATTQIITKVVHLIGKTQSVRLELGHLQAQKRHQTGKIAIGIKARTRWGRSSHQQILEEVLKIKYQHQSRNATLSMGTKQSCRTRLRFHNAKSRSKTCRKLCSMIQTHLLSALEET